MSSGDVGGKGGRNGSSYANAGGDPASPPLRNNPLQMLGIAMICDQRGSGARLVARYPTQPSARESVATSSGTTAGTAGGTNRSDHHQGATATATNTRKNDPFMEGENHSAEDDLFFTLTAHQMAKLFRTKKSLCNQPMTLRVNRTVFCCYAVLIDDDDEEPNVLQSENNNSSGSISGNADGGGDNDDDLRLFSVVVALSVPAHQTSGPFSSFWDAGSEDQHDLERFLRQLSISSTSATYGTNKATAARVSSTFLAVRRVHLSLARYCRALAREENRCGYVRRQANSFFAIRAEQQKRWDAPLSGVHAAASGMAASNGHHHHQGPNLAPSSTSVVTPNTLERKGGRHTRSHSYGTSPLTLILDDSTIKFHEVTPAAVTIEQEQEKEQEILELMLASPSPEMPAGSPQHHGNLVRELVTVFHALSRKDFEYPPTPNSLLCERDGVVYVNRHIAVPIEAVGLDCSQITDGPILRPYHTLLFPHASPSELLQTFHSSGSAPPQRMEQLLLTVNPQKGLTEIAVDAGLPLHVTMDIASFLVTRGACITSPVVTSQSRLACVSAQKLPEVALEFTQAFPEVNMFGVVSFLTCSRTLGEALAVLTDFTNDEGAWMRETLLASPSFRIRSPDLAKSMHIATVATGIGFSRVILPIKEEDLHQQHQQHSRPPNPQEQPMLQQCAENLEELLYAIAIWLLSHKVLTHLQEYLVVVAASSVEPVALTTDSAGSVNAGSSSSLISTLKRETEEEAPKGSNSNLATTSTPNDPDENLFRELVEAGYFNGDLSLTALSWKTGIDPQTLRSWGLRHRRVRVLTRMPTAADDWAAAAALEIPS